MSGLIGKIPFLRLLVPVVAGIVFCTFFPNIQSIVFPLSVLGLAGMLLSFLVGENRRFNCRWLFGSGVFLFLFSLSALQYLAHEKQSAFAFSEAERAYFGVVTDIPEIKPKSVACNVQINFPLRKKVIIYVQQTDDARLLTPGDEIVFSAKMQPFRNFGNPDDFDYERFMKIKGFSASGYVSAANWQKTGRKSHSLYILAQQFRAKALDFYRSFNLDPHAYAFISALTLGYKAELPDTMKEAFRASGTAHVLAVSGLHVGIIYIIINLLFSFLGKSGKPYITRQWLVIIVLWGYVFITGMSVSAIRAAIMLTIFCAANMQHRRGITYNTLAATALGILILFPFSLFDIGFQMSFAAVFAILFFLPKISALYVPKNKAGKYAWGLFSVSLAAQIGIFPLVLHYFGTFPTYFFITNLLVVPLIGVIMYATLPMILVSALQYAEFVFLDTLHTIFQWVLKNLIHATLHIVYIAETLPFAQLSGNYISFFQLIALLFFVYMLAQSLFSRRPRHLIIAALSVLLFLSAAVYENATTPPPQLVIFNSPQQSEIAVFADNKRVFLDVPANGFIPHPQKSILRLSDNKMYARLETEERFPLNVLILSQSRQFNIKQITSLFRPDVVVLDSSLPRYASERMASECIQLGISVHDVAKSGAFLISF